MNNQVDQLQASRLKQILFPRKAKPTRSLVTSGVEQSKENKETNVGANGHYGNRHANLRDQISKLKEGIQSFVDKHMLNENYLTTPRQCLELIKYMSDSMVNYEAEIEEAIGTLIESIPRPLARLMPMSKYFLMGLKFSYLNSLYYLNRRRSLGEGFKEIKNQHMNRKAHLVKSEQHRVQQNNKLDLLIVNKINKAFNRWRINVHMENKSLIEKYYISANQQMNSMLHMFQNESQIILYLQKLLHTETNADAIQILLYNHKANMLRGYKAQSEHLGSVFESVREQSYIHDDVGTGSYHDNIEAPQQSFRRGPTKRMEMKLEHSLTKICLVKRQSIAVDQMRNDPDYTSSIDDFTIFSGLSARDTFSSCILTPLVSKSGCIGLIRQYFYNKTGQRPNSETVGVMTLVLQNCIKTSQRFEQAKQKSVTIRNLYYLKAIKILNSLEKDQHEQVFYSLISQYYNIKFNVEYSYTVAYTLENLPHFTVQNKGEGDRSLPNIVAALSKMVQHQTYFLYDHHHLYFMLDSKIIVFDLLNVDDNSCPEQKKQNEEHTPVGIIMQLLQKKQLRRLRKEKQEEDYQLEQQRMRKEEQNRELLQKKNNILQFCMQQKKVQNQSELIKVIEEYMQKFDKERKMRVEVEYKNRTKNMKLSQSSIVVYDDENMRVCLETRLPKNQEYQAGEIVLTPLAGLCASLIEKIKKPYEIPSFNHINLKSETHYNPDNIGQGLVSLINDVMQLSEVEIRTIQSPNPFTPETYYCFIEKKDLVLQPTSSFLKCIKSSSFQPYSGLNPIVTILYLGNELFIVVDKFLGINEAHLMKLKSIYDKWVSQVKQHEEYIKTKQKNCKHLRGFMKFNQFGVNALQKVFYLIKNCKIRIRSMPHLLENYIHKSNRTALYYAFSLLRTKKQGNILKMSDLSKNITKLYRTIYNLSHIKDFFVFYRLNKAKSKAISTMSSILTSYRNDFLNVAFSHIYLKKNLINTNKLWTLPLIFNRTIAPCFQLLKRLSKAKETLGIIESETECSIISKMDSLYQIFKLVKQKFDNFQFFLCLKNGAYLQLCENRIEVLKQFRDRPNFQYFQFSSQPKSKIRHIVWLVPEVFTVSLIEKHYLQVLSRAIEEGFGKFIYKNEQFLSFISMFTLNKSKKLAQRALKNLRSFTMSKIKVEQYGLRDQFYEASIQVENFRLMQKEQNKEEQQRLRQVSESLRMKQKHEENLSKWRKSIVRLEISSKKLEEAEGKQRLQKQKKELMQVFSSWRVEAAYRTKYAQRRAMARKKQNFASSSLVKILKQIVMENYRYSHQRILIESAHVRARDLSAQKRPLKQNRPQNSLHQNRLLTFQDELNEFTQRESEQKKQISIIPISFKHFESSKKQNYDVTDDDLKKMNGGAYKLNAKTLKFLKRMGKLNN